MLLNAENARVTVFTVSELLRENQQEGGGKIKKIFLNVVSVSNFDRKFYVFKIKFSCKIYVQDSNSGQIFVYGK